VVDISLLCRPSSHTWFQELYVINPSVLLQGLHPALVRYLASLLVCAVLYVVTFAPFFILSPECAHLSPRTFKPLFMFFHFILCYPSPYCIPHAIIKCSMTRTILISYFPCLAARFFPGEDFSIHPLAPLVAYLLIWDNLIRQNVSSIIRWFSSVRFHFDQKIAVPAASFLFCSNSIAAARICASGAPTKVAFPPSPIHLLTAFNNDWLSHEYSNGLLSVCYKATVKTLPIHWQADLSWSPLLASIRECMEKSNHHNRVLWKVILSARASVDINRTSLSRHDLRYCESKCTTCNIQMCNLSWKTRNQFLHTDSNIILEHHPRSNFQKHESPWRIF